MSKAELDYLNQFFNNDQMDSWIKNKKKWMLLVKMVI